MLVSVYVTQIHVSHTFQFSHSDDVFAEVENANVTFCPKLWKSKHEGMSLTHDRLLIGLTSLDQYRMHKHTSLYPYTFPLWRIFINCACHTKIPSHSYVTRTYITSQLF